MEVPLLAAIGVLSAIGGAAFSLSPVPRTITYHLNEKYPNQLPTASDLIAEYFRGVVTPEEFFNKMKKLGFSKGEARRLIQVSQQMLDARSIILLKWKKELKGYKENLEEFNWLNEMKKIGIDEITAKRLELAMLYYPSPSDFIRFAVREVFKPDKVEKYELDKEFPKDILPYSRAAGLPDEVLKWYWRAHWSLPSAEMVIRMVNMLQPKVIDTVLEDGTRYGDKYKDFGIDPDNIRTTYDDLSEYLAMADISPFWRDRIKALTFPPITRVDLRRIYALGLIGDAELLARLLELGYSYRDALKLAEFYKHYKMSQQRDLTRTQIEKAYKEQEINRETAKNYLLGLGYDESEAELILTLVENDIEDEIEKEQIKTLEYLFRAGIINLEKVSDELDKLDIPASKKDMLISKFIYAKKRRVALPSKSDVLKWLRDGTIDDKTFIEKMRQIGFTDEDIKLYYKNTTGRELKEVS